MKGACVIAWLFSSLGMWRLTQLEAQDTAQCQRAEHPIISYKGEEYACSDYKV
jgi:chondroitin sulfate proteoglycan 4